MRLIELISTGDGQIMETLDNIGIKLFVFGCTERMLFFCVFVRYSASVSVLQIVISDT
jgi:hypothetical protein